MTRLRSILFIIVTESLPIDLRGRACIGMAEMPRLVPSTKKSNAGKNNMSELGRDDMRIGLAVEFILDLLTENMTKLRKRKYVVETCSEVWRISGAVLYTEHTDILKAWNALEKMKKIVHLPDTLSLISSD